jgi:hypothetical protein
MYSTYVPMPILLFPMTWKHLPHIDLFGSASSCGRRRRLGEFHKKVKTLTVMRGFFCVQVGGHQGSGPDGDYASRSPSGGLEIYDGRCLMGRCRCLHVLGDTVIVLCYWWDEVAGSINMPQRRWFDFRSRRRLQILVWWMWFASDLPYAIWARCGQVMRWHSSSATVVCYNGGSKVRS